MVFLFISTIYNGLTRKEEVFIFVKGLSLSGYVLFIIRILLEDFDFTEIKIKTGIFHAIHSIVERNYLTKLSYDQNVYSSILPFMLSPNVSIWSFGLKAIRPILTQSLSGLLSYFDKNHVEINHLNY